MNSKNLFNAEVVNFIDPKNFTNGKILDDKTILRYEIVKSLGGEKIVFNDGDFFYKLNTYGFRSNHFDKFKKENTNILFAGCSVTFGQGVPEDCTWTQFLSNKINDKLKYKINHYNISNPGASIYEIIKNILAFLNSIGTPDYIFMLLPSSSRSIKFNKKNKKFMHTGFFILNNKIGLPKNKNLNYINKEYVKNYCHEDQVLLNITLISMLEKICENKNIKLFWSSWDPEDLYFYEQINFKNKISLLKELNNYNIISKDNCDSFCKNNEIKYWESSRDGIHPSSHWHFHLANIFFNGLNFDE